MAAQSCAINFLPEAFDIRDGHPLTYEKFEKILNEQLSENCLEGKQVNYQKLAQTIANTPEGENIKRNILDWYRKDYQGEAKKDFPAILAEYASYYHDVLDHKKRFAFLAQSFWNAGVEALVNRKKDSLRASNNVNPSQKNTGLRKNADIAIKGDCEYIPDNEYSLDHMNEQYFNFEGRMAPYLLKCGMTAKDFRIFSKSGAAK